MAEFDPDAFLATAPAPAAGGFDPDAFLKGSGAASSGLSSYVPKAVADIPHETYDQFATGLDKMRAAFNPLSAENHKITEDSSRAGFFDPSGQIERGKLLASGIGGAAQAAGSWLTGPVRALGGHGLEALDEQMRKGAVKLHGGEEGVPPAKTYEESAGAAESLLGGMAPRGFTARGPLPAAPPRPVAPSIEELHDAASQGYTNARGLGVEMRPQPVRRLADDIFSDLHNDGFRQLNVPKTWSAVDELKNPAGKTFTIDDVESVRKALNKAASNPMEGAEREAARRAISSIDDYMAGLDPKDVAVNPHYAARVAEEMQGARGNYAAAKRAETIENKQELAADRAGSTGSGANVNNATRQKIREILASPKQRRGFSDEEIAQMRRIVRGTTTGNIARLIGKLAPTGVVSSVPSVIGAAAAGVSPAALAIPAVGFAGKLIGDASTARQVGHLNRMIRQRSPLSRASTPPPALPGPPSLAYPALTGAPGLGRIPFDSRIMQQLPGPVPVGADEDQRQRGGRLNAQPNRGEQSQPKGFAKGGHVRKGPPIPGARKARDGEWYVRDHTRPGKFLRVVM